MTEYVIDSIVSGVRTTEEMDAEPYGFRWRRTGKRCARHSKGRATPFSDENLAWRSLGDQRKTRIAAAAQTAREAFLRSVAAETIEASPAIDPIRRDRASVAGKIVVLPPLRNRDWVMDAGRSWLAVLAAESRDYMVKCLDIVRQEIASLEVKWNAVVSQHASYQQQELAVIEQIDALIRDAIVKARDLDAKFAGLIAEWLTRAKDVLQALPEGGADAANIPNNNELAAAGLTVDMFRALAAGIEDQRARF